MRVRRFPACLAVLVASGLVVALAPAASASRSSERAGLRSKLLTLSALPSGWTEKSTTSGTKSTTTTSGAPGCLRGGKAPKTYVKATAEFHAKTTLPQFDEGLAIGPNERLEWDKIVHALSKCKSFTITSQGVKLHATVKPISFPRMGKQSGAYKMTMTEGATDVTLDVFVFRTSSLIGFMVYGGLTPLDNAQALTLAKAAAAKASS